MRVHPHMQEIELDGSEVRQFESGHMFHPRRRHEPEFIAAIVFDVAASLVFRSCIRHVDVFEFRHDQPSRLLCRLHSDGRCEEARHQGPGSPAPGLVSLHHVATIEDWRPRWARGRTPPMPTSCGRCGTPVDWCGLPCLGVQEAGDASCELRNCPQCKTTLGHPVPRS